jgi:hypothetical protein
MVTGAVKRLDSSSDSRIEHAASGALRTPAAGDRAARSSRIRLDRVVESSNAGGLFRVRLGRRRTSLTNRPRPEASPQHGAPAGGRLSRTRVESALRRYCSGCARETEHVLWPGREPAGLASIRWPVAAPAADSTICQDCGQLRVAAAVRTKQDRKQESVKIRSRTRSNLDPSRREGTRRERQWPSIRTSPNGTARI